MADYQVYASEQELREALDDVNDLLADFKQPQRQIDEELDPGRAGAGGARRDREEGERL